MDTRHSNSSRTFVYLKAGAVRDAGVMRRHLEEKIAQANRDVKSANLAIERAQENLALIEAGNLDDVYL